MNNSKPLAYAAFAAMLAFMQGAWAVGLPDVPNAHFNVHQASKLLPSGSDLHHAFLAGKPDVWLRLRYEDVKDEIPAGHPLESADNARMYSLRAALGYTTARFNGFWARAELEANSVIGSDQAFNIDEDLTFPPGPGGSRIAEGHAIIPDNEFAEINEAFVGWRSASGGCVNAPAACDGHTTIKAGRQTIIYDNHRWVGDIIWRQNQQSFDAIRIDNTSINNLGISYARVFRVNRLFGDDSPFNEFEMDSSHLINVSYKTPIGKLTGYGYLLDFEDNNRTPPEEGVGTLAGPFNASYDSDTWGLRFLGKRRITNAFTLLYELEYARQAPENDANPSFDDNDYHNIEVGGAFELGGKPVILKIGREVLEGNGRNAVQTPLATVHAFNGWADKFVGAPGGSLTPPGGIEDISLTAVVKGLWGKSKLVVKLHDYEADTTVGGVQSYGDEISLAFAKPFTKRWLGLVKYTSFHGDDDANLFDTDKFWVMAQYRFK